MKPWMPVLARVLAGFGGGYALGALVAVMMAKTLPIARLDAVLTGAMTGFVVHALTIIWAFGASTALRACLGVLLPIAVFGALVVR